MDNNPSSQTKKITRSRVNLSAYNEEYIMGTVLGHYGFALH
jgi:hypothetical protein